MSVWPSRPGAGQLAGSRTREGSIIDPSWRDSTIPAGSHILSGNNRTGEMPMTGV